MTKPEIRISEKARINGIPVPNGWGLSRVSDNWYPPGGSWHGYDSHERNYDNVFKSMTCWPDKDSA